MRGVFDTPIAQWRVQMSRVANWCWCWLQSCICAFAKVRQVGSRCEQCPLASRMQQNNRELHKTWGADPTKGLAFAEAGVGRSSRMVQAPRAFFLSRSGLASVCQARASCCLDQSLGQRRAKSTARHSREAVLVIGDVPIRADCRYSVAYAGRDRDAATVLRLAR
jgi:hypothetical protein